MQNYNEIKTVELIHFEIDLLPEFLVLNYDSLSRKKNKNQFVQTKCSTLHKMTDIFGTLNEILIFFKSGN